jgi:hypothetical protein
MLTRLVGALLVLLAGLTPASLDAQAIAPVGVTTNTANVSHEVSPVLGREAFVMSDEASSRTWFIIMGAVVGGVVGGIELQKSAKHCDDCFFSGQVAAAGIGLSAAAGALAGFLVHEAFFTSSSPGSND